MFAKLRHMRSFEKINPCEMAKSHGCLLVQVNLALVAVFNIANKKSFKAFLCALTSAGLRWWC